MKFELLADSIKQINDKASSAAKSAVNQLMTLRNWVIGYYIVEYEQDGSDRAQYGSHLLKNLSNGSFNTIISRICENDKLLTNTSGSVANRSDTVGLFSKSDNSNSVDTVEPI